MVRMVHTTYIQKFREGLSLQKTLNLGNTLCLSFSVSPLCTAAMDSKRDTEELQRLLEVSIVFSQSVLLSNCKQICIRTFVYGRLIGKEALLNAFPQP